MKRLDMTPSEEMIHDAGEVEEKGREPKSWADRVMNVIVWGNPEGTPLQHKNKN